MSGLRPPFAGALAIGPIAVVRRRVVLGRSVAVRGRVWTHGAGTIRLDDDVVLDAREAPIELHAHAGATIAVGRGAVLGPGSSLEAMAHITIGAGARVGRYAKVMDNNFHPLDRAGRLPASRPVTIGEGAEIGDRAILLPGASVAAGAKVPAGAVISRRFGAPRGQAAASDSRLGEPGPSVRSRGWLAGKLVAAIEILRAKWYLRTCEIGRHVHAGGRVLVDNAGRIRVRSHAVFLGGMISSAITCGADASIEIGESTIFNYGVSLEASRSVRIGSRCQFGSYVRISDRTGDVGAPITIGDDVWVAHGATIEPGVTIGNGSVISAGARVTADVPPNSLAIGDPARAMSLTLRTERPRAPVATAALASHGT